MSSSSRRWSWYISSLFYRLSYVRIAHQLDEDLFAYLGDRTQGAVVADCGCGPGVVVEKFLRRGASQVYAIDANDSMLYQTRSRLADSVAKGRVVVVHRAFDAHMFSELQERFLEGRGFDVILFKRSLYVRPEKASSLLQAGAKSLNPDGILAVVHGDRSVRRYAFGSGQKMMTYTPFHLFNRCLSLISDKLGIGRYMLYSRNGLLNLMRKTLPDLRVESIPTQQRAYNLVAALN
jgi:SAM-dependent methyltransferase